MAINTRIKLITFFFIISTQISGQDFSQKTAAILFANNNYTYTKYFIKLNSPVVDIALLGQSLTSLGIHYVSKNEIADRKQFFLELTNFIKECKENKKIENIIIYYSGHGLDAGNDDLWVPLNFNLGLDQVLRDVQTKNLSSFLDYAFTNNDFNNYEERQNIIEDNMISQCISHSEVLDSLKGYNVILISDACRDKITFAERGPLNRPFTKIENLIDKWKNTNEPSSPVDKNSVFNDFTNYYGNITNRRLLFMKYSHEIREVVNRQRSFVILNATNPLNTSKDNPKLFSGLFTQSLIQYLSFFNKDEDLVFNYGSQTLMQKNIDKAAAELPEKQNPPQTVIINFSLPFCKFLRANDLGNLLNRRKPPISDTQTIVLKNNIQIVANYIFSFSTQRLDMDFSGEKIKKKNPNFVFDSLYIETNGYNYYIKCNLYDEDGNIILTTSEKEYTTTPQEEKSFFNRDYTELNIPKEICDKVKKVKVIVTYARDQRTAPSASLRMGFTNETLSNKLKVIPANNAIDPPIKNYENPDLTIPDKNYYLSKFLENRTKEYELSLLGLDAFKRGEYFWAINFFKQCKFVETSLVWMANYPYYAGSYFLIDSTEKGVRILDQMLIDLKIPFTYLHHKQGVNFLLSSLTDMLTYLHSEKQKNLTNSYIDKIFSLKSEINFD